MNWWVNQKGDKTVIAQSFHWDVDKKSQDEGRSTFIYCTEWNMMWQVQITTGHVSQHLLDICEEERPKR